LEQIITGNKERMDVTIVAKKGGEYIEATIADANGCNIVRTWSLTKEEVLQELAEGAVAEFHHRGEVEGEDSAARP
jgi:hypothetical protein